MGLSMQATADDEMAALSLGKCQDCLPLAWAIASWPREWVELFWEILMA